MTNMKITVLSLIWVAVATGCCSQKETVLKTMTYNTYSGRNAGMEAIAEVIRRNDPDIVALQEVERFTELNPGDTPAILAGMTGLKYHTFFHALDIRSGGDYGNAILSKYPIMEERSFRIGTPGRDYMRSFGYVRIRKKGHEVCFATTHLDHRKDDSLRIAQVREILRLTENIDIPVILGGDMNARPEEAPVRLLSAKFNVGNSPAEPTTDDDGGKTIDYLMYAPGSAIEVISGMVDYAAGQASDHYPVLVTFKLTVPASPALPE